MKNLAILLSCFVLISCSKESDQFNSDLTQQNVAQLSVTDAFKVGEIDAAGSATITYDLNDLMELTSCAVREESSSGLTISDEAPGYYLSGTGSSNGSTTTFKVELILDGTNLYWQDRAHIAMCQTSGATPCDLVILDVEDFTCSNENPLACNDNEIGGGSAGAYPSCGDTDWPWAGASKDKK